MAPDLNKLSIGTLRLLLDQANKKEDYHRARLNEAMTAQDAISAEAERRGELL